MRVRIKVHPAETELDGVALDGFVVGMVRDVSSSLGSWLVAQGYADLEMRSMHPEDDGVLKSIDPSTHARRRSSD